MESVIDGLKIIENNFKPLLYDQKSLSKSTSEFVDICKKQLYDCRNIKSIIFSYHSLLSWIPWTYSNMPQWEDLKYVHLLFEEEYKRIVALDNVITENNQATSFSYRILQIHDNVYKDKRIIVAIEFGATNSMTIIEDISVRINFVVNICNNEYPNFINSINGGNFSQNELSLEVEEFCAKFCDEVKDELAARLIRAVVASSIYLDNNAIVYFIISDIVRNSDCTLGLGGMFIILNKDSKLDENELLYRLEHLSDLMAIRFVQHFQMKLQQNESIKSAKAAIMSRNMSHNLGSHVMAYLKQNLGSVIDIVKGNVIEKIVSNNQLNSKIDLWNKYLSSETSFKEVKEDENIYINQIELPFLVGIGHFISYMQERQDYIATVATDYVPYFSSLNFKDDIYDVLNPDLRYLRHTDRIGGRPDNILLSFIARSEGLQRPVYASVLAYEGANIELKKQAEFESLKSCCVKRRDNDIVLKFRNFDGLNDVQYIPVTISLDGETVDISRRVYFDGGNKDFASCGIGRKDLDSMRSLNISLPGGIAGRQAIFSIVENIIRNAAKHGAWEKRLDIAFDVFDCSPKDIRFANSKVEEDISQLREFLSDNGYFNKEDSRDLYVLTITDNISIGSRKVDQLKAAIEQKYVYDDGSMINENKGIKEIKISASWLRNLTHEEDEVGKVPILNVRLSDGHLQYIICVPKVKKYAVICSAPELYDREFLQSIYYYTEESFKAEKNKSFEVIAILDNSVGEEIYEEIKNRIIPISPNHIVRIDNDDLDAIRAKLINMQAGKVVPEDLQQKIDDIYARMYNMNDCPEITIIDKKVAKSARETYCSDRIVCLSGETATLPVFMYKTHLETEKNFYSFLDAHLLEEDGKDKEDVANLKFAEGISGGNSTDRLVRGVNCNFTSEWYYKHLNAMRKRVAIFDERLFSRMTNLTDNELVAIDRTIVDTIELAAQNTPDDNLKFKEIQELKKIGLEVDENDTYQQVYDFVFEDIKMLLSAKKYAKSHLIAVNFYKNVHIYNIIYNNVTCSFDIYGYTGVEKVNGEIKFTIEKVGEILRVGDTIKIKFEDDGFDYLSIHQGLLDKLYHQWEIIGNCKCSVTQAFYEKIMKKEKTVDFDDYQYLPGLIIHSGRAKPSTMDMPQKQPFIQYASVDHAVSDCKFTLVELFDNARYE